MQNHFRQLLYTLPRLKRIYQTVYSRHFGVAIFRIRTSPTWIKLSVLIILIGFPLLTYGGMFLASDNVAFSFSSRTCVNKPTVFPGIHSSKQGNVFELEQVTDISFGSTPVYSSKTCINLNRQPEKPVTEQLTIQTPLGLATTIHVNTPALPELIKTDMINPNISGKDGMGFKLSVADNTFSYSLAINNKNLPCTVSDTNIWCPFTDTTFTQGSLFPYTIHRHFADTEPTVLFSSSAQTSEPVTLTPITPLPEETLFTPLQSISIQANKPIKTLTEVSLQAPDGSLLPVQTTIDESNITITAESPLARASTFLLTVASAQATDSGYLVEPFKLTFHTSGGPKVAGINLPKVGVPLSSQIVITTDIDLSSEHNSAALVNVSAGETQLAVQVGFNRNKITITPLSPLPKCTNFTITLSAGSVSIHGIGNGQGWSYTARSICHEKVSIGSSFAGRAITAYKFGSGARKVLYVGGLHGSEKSSTRTLDAWITELESQFQRIPSDKTIIVIPNANPDGYTLGSRANARGVDLNRNFPANDWSTDVHQPGGILLPGGGGAYPLSEPESSSLALYIQAVSPEVVLTYHAVARTVIHNGSGNSAALAQLYAQKAGFNVSSSDQEDGVFNYATTGELETWLHDSLGIPTLLIENATMSSNELPKQGPAMWAVVEQ